jgi:hypothetical protein
MALWGKLRTPLLQHAVEAPAGHTDISFRPNELIRSDHEQDRLHHTSERQPRADRLSTMEILKAHSPYGIQVRFSKWALGAHAKEG